MVVQVTQTGDTITLQLKFKIWKFIKLTMDVVSASIGDVVYVKNGVYRENLPLSCYRSYSTR